MKYKKKILKNGLRVVVAPMTENPAVTVYVMVEAGAKYEMKENNGISHFLEHMVFKGTPKRPKSTTISRELDSLGADYNAFTSDEYTGYYAKVEKRHLDQALDIISDMYLNPLFPEDEIEREKGVIIEEIRMYEDLPQRKVHNALEELLYGDVPAGWTILGPEENIRSFTRETFLDYRAKHYKASATTVVVAGNVIEKEVFKKIEKLFASMSSGKKQNKLKVKESQSRPGLRMLYKDTGQTHLAIALRTFSLFDKQRAAIQVLSVILGGGMSSRLFAKMRDELGICYYVNAWQRAYTDHGYLSITAGIDTSRVELGVTTLLQEVTRLKNERVADEELRRAKDHIAGSLMLGLETSDDVADYLARQETLRKEIITPEAWINEIEKVTSKDIQNIAKKYFVDARLNMAVIGPYKDDKKFTAVLTLDN